MACRVRFLITLTALTTVSEVGWVALAFVVGSVISVVIGLASGGLHASTDTVNQTAIQGRFTGGGGDPNVQAAGYVATMFLIMGLIPMYRGPAIRISLVLSFALVTVGFLATQSRGGLLALIAAAIVAMIVAPRYRRRILGLVVITSRRGRRAARDDARCAVADHELRRRLERARRPLAGRARRVPRPSVRWRRGRQLRGGRVAFVLRPGAISRIEYLVDVPHLVHNTYLQLLAETGMVGLALDVVVILGSLRATWLRSSGSRRAAGPRYADLARGVMIGTVGMLVALFFISDGNDLRLWVLLAMGPALLTLAGRTRARGP